MYKMLLFYITFFLITIHGEVINASNTCNNKNNYQLPAEIEQLIEHYQDDAAIEAIIKNTAQYEHQDFLHTILHPREAAFEKTDALHKKIIYFFPEYIKTYQGKSIGISVGDIINVGTHTLQYYLDKREVINVLDKLTHNFTLIIEENLDIIISSLEENNLEAITTLLIQNIWSRERINYSVLQSYLKYRLIYAAIECIKKNNTPPPFFMHGKTTEGRLIDRENLSIATVTSFIPPAILEKFFDGDTKTTLSDTWWSNDTTKNSLMFCAIGSQYALEGAKQAELIESIDETLCFNIVKEIITGLFFFHYDLKNSIHGILRLALNKHIKLFRESIIAFNQAKSSAEEERKKCLECIKMFFTNILQAHQSTIITNQRLAQRLYNTATNALLLSPAAYKIIRFGWKLWQAINSESNKQKGTDQ